VLFGGRLSPGATLGTSRGGGTARDVDVGTEGRDRLVGTANGDNISGEGGGDRIYGRGGDDFLFGGDGFDKVAGGAGDDFALGGEGGDELRGGAGVDELYGQRGDDELWAGGGDDLLAGGEGADRLTGGGGADEFRLAERDGARDVVLDFQQGFDVLTVFSDGLTMTFLGARAFDGSEDAVRVTRKKGVSLVRVDDDGDRQADMIFRVVVEGGGRLTTDDFDTF